MQIKILGNRKLLVILPLVIVLMLIIGFVTYRTPSNAPDANQLANPTNTSSSQSESNNGSVVTSELDTKDFLYEKAVSLVIMISKSKSDYLQDPVYQNLKGSTLSVARSQVLSMGNSLKIRTLSTIVSNDGLSGSVYLRLESAEKPMTNFTLSYRKNEQGEWKFSGISSRKALFGGSQ